MRVLVVVIALSLVLTTRAGAQPAQPACSECVRGDALIEKYGLQSLRAIADQIEAAPTDDTLSPEQYAKIVALRDRTPALIRVGALDDNDIAAIASSLCHATLGTCVAQTTRALQCLGDHCAVALPPPPPHSIVDIAVVPQNCHQFATHKHWPPYGLGMDWSTGVQRSQYPNDGHAWSFGMEGRLRFARRIGAVARIDRIAGRDEATDTNDDGNDDISTGSITRIVGMAGPSIILDNTRFEDTTRSLRLDLLGGYLSTRSQENESGPAVGFDLAYQIWSIRMGVRVVQGLGDAQDATVALAHFGFLTGAAPDNPLDPKDCGAETSARSTGLAIGFDIPLGGYGFSKELGYLATGFGVEAYWHLSPAFDLMVHGDLLLYPGDKRDRVIHQAALAGIRIDDAPRKHRSSAVGFSTTVMGGYTFGSGLTPTSTGSGPVVDLAAGWGGQGDDGAGGFRLHARFGVGPDNTDYRALFFSGNFELRVDPRRWRDRL